MYHESLGIPRTKPALNLIYSISSCFLIMHRAKTVLYGGTCHFLQAQIMLLLPHSSLCFSQAQNLFFFFVAHSRTIFACLTIFFLKRTQPSRLKKKLKKEKKKTCFLYIENCPRSPHRGQRKRGGGLIGFSIDENEIQIRCSQIFICPSVFQKSFPTPLSKPLGLMIID